MGITIAVIDGQHASALGHALDFIIDFRALLSYLKKRAEDNKSTFLRAYYLTPTLEGVEQNSLRPLLNWLEYNGFSVATIVVREYKDAQGVLRRRGSIEVLFAKIVLDSLYTVPKLDEIIMLTGNGAYRPVLDSFPVTGTRSTIMSSLKGQGLMVADELRRASDEFVEVADLKQLLERQARP